MENEAERFLKIGKFLKTREIIELLKQLKRYDIGRIGKNSFYIKSEDLDNIIKQLESEL